MKIEIDYSLFSVTLTKNNKTLTENNKTKKAKNKKSGMSPDKKFFLRSSKLALLHFLKSSDITLGRLSFSVPNSEPHIFSVRYESIFSLFSALSVLLINKARSLSISPSSIVFTTENGGVPDINLNISLRLYNLIISIVLFSFDFFKYKLRQKEKTKA